MIWRFLLNNYFRLSKLPASARATASVLTDNGITPELVPEHFQSEGLIDAFKQHDLFEKRCWLIQAESPRKILRDSLQKMGAQIILTPVYRNVPAAGDYTFLLAELEQQKLDWILFASPSAVQNFHQILPTGFWESLTAEPKIACLGEITANAVKDLVGAFRLHQTFKTLSILFKHFAKSTHKYQKKHE